MAIPLLIWGIGALGGAAYLSRTYDDVLDIFTGETAEDKLRKQLEKEGTLQITNLPKFPGPAAPSAAQLEAMKGTGSGDVIWKPISLQAQDQQNVAEYKQNYEPVIAVVGGKPKPQVDPLAMAAMLATGVGVVALLFRK